MDKKISKCVKCGESMAVLFLSEQRKNAPARGYCLKCASEMGLKPVDDMLEKMGVTPDDIEYLQEEMAGMFEGVDMTDMEDMLSKAPTMEEVEEIAKELGGFAFSSEDIEKIKLDDTESEGKSFTDFFQDKMKNLIEKNEDDEEEESFMAAENMGKAQNTDKKDKKKQKRKFLDGFCDDLTEKARNGKIDRIIGREKEMKRAIQILNRRSKNNPCLIGEPGVGKTAIAEGIALEIVEKKVPMRLRDKEIWQLDLTALVAGTQFRGQFESRVKGLLEEVRAAGNIILFVDEVHNLVGAGESEGAMSAANIFKPALSRGEIQVMGATTFTEYRKYIEKDTALERRFQPITVNEPSLKESIEILKGIKDYYEQHHRVKLPNRVITLAVELSERYITDRFLPDKAIDLIDEAGSYRSLASHELEEADALALDIRKLEDEIDLLMEAEEIDYRVVVSKRVVLKQKEEELLVVSEKLADIEVTEEDIARVIELWTGISYARIKESELGKVSGLEDRLKLRVIGQDYACNVVADAIKRGRVQISSRRRPPSFIFVGPTAVGKTELVKVLADELFDSPDPLIRLDMSEFMEQHSVSKMIGSPPGYIGYDEAGQLTEKVRRKPYSIILFDEIEKAHPNIMNLLLQILDEGHITDAQGRKINFENTVIVMTSNAGSQFKDSSMGFNKSAEEISMEKAEKGLSEFLRPEFLSRVDEIVVFSPLSEENYADIAKLSLAEFKEVLLDRDIEFVYSPSVPIFIAKKTYGDAAGARMIRKFIQKELENKIAGLIIDNPNDYPRYLMLTVEGDEFVLFDGADLKIPLGMGNEKQ